MLVTFHTLKLAMRLEAAGMTRQQAEIITYAIAEFLSDCVLQQQTASDQLPLPPSSPEISQHVH